MIARQCTQYLPLGGAAIGPTALGGMGTAYVAGGPRFAYPRDGSVDGETDGVEGGGAAGGGFVGALASGVGPLGAVGTPTWGRV